MAPSEEQDIILKARAGDRGAFDKLYSTHVARIYAVVASRTRDQDDIEDLVQVAFMRAFEGLNRFRGDAAFSTWLTRIAMNVCVSHYEAISVRRKWSTWLGTPEGTAHMGPAAVADPEAVVHRRQCQHLVRRSIQRLPRHYREAMRLRYVEDRSYSEIEDVMQVPMGTVKTWLYRGREMLQEAFEERGVKM